MKLVGQTVSRLSSSFSQDKDDGNSCGGAAADAPDEAMSLTASAAKAEFPLLDLEPRRTAPKEFAAVVSRWELHNFNFKIKKSVFIIEILFMMRYRSAPTSNRNTLHRRSQSVGLLDRLTGAPPARGGSTAAAGPAATTNASREKSDRRHRSQRKTEVWSWGVGDKGQAGQGDVLDRLQPSVVSALSADGTAVQGPAQFLPHNCS